MMFLLRLFRWLFLALLLLPLFALALFFIAVEESPMVPELHPPTVAQTSLARKTVSRLQSALRQPDARVMLSQHELDSLASVASQATQKLRVIPYLSIDGVAVDMSWQLPRLTYYLNIEAKLGNSDNGLVVQELSIGRLSVPPHIAQYGLERLGDLLAQGQQKNLVSQTLQVGQVRFPYLVLSQLSYADFKQFKEGALASTQELLGLQPPLYLVEVQRYLNEINQKLPKRGKISLAVISKLLMSRVSLVAKPQEAADWNSSMIWALAINYANPKFELLLQSSPLQLKQSSVRPRVALGGRRDLAHHFLYSALLEQVGGAETSFAIGEMKELSDSARGGSGFSFADLAADRAGIAFSRYLMNEKTAWEGLLKLTSPTSSEHSFFPPTEILRERITEEEFTRDYGSTLSETYQREVQKIDKLIYALPLYQPY